MNKRIMRIKLTGVMIGLMMLLVACGGGTTEQETGGGPVTLTFWDNQQTESGLSEYQQTAVKEFEKANPNINIKVTTVPYDQYQQRLQLAVEEEPTGCLYSGPDLEPRLRLRRCHCFT